MHAGYTYESISGEEFYHAYNTLDKEINVSPVTWKRNALDIFLTFIVSTPEYYQLDLFNGTAIHLPYLTGILELQSLFQIKIPHFKGEFQV